MHISVYNRRNTDTYKKHKLLLLFSMIARVQCVVLGCATEFRSTLLIQRAPISPISFMFRFEFCE